MSIKEAVFYWAVCDACGEDIDEESGLRIKREDTTPDADCDYVLVESREGADPLIFCADCACRRVGHIGWTEWTACCCLGRIKDHPAADGHEPSHRYCLRCSFVEYQQVAS